MINIEFLVHVLAQNVSISLKAQQKLDKNA